MTAFACIMIKQWLTQNAPPSSAVSLVAWARLRQFRRMGLEKWLVPEIIALLPLALHSSVFLFLGGLVAFLWRLSLIIAIPALAILILFVLLYLFATTSPLLYPDCPYRTPLHSQLGRIGAVRRGMLALLAAIISPFFFGVRYAVLYCFNGGRTNNKADEDVDLEKSAGSVKDEVDELDGVPVLAYSPAIGRQKLRRESTFFSIRSALSQANVNTDYLHHTAEEAAIEARKVELDGYALIWLHSLPAMRISNCVLRAIAVAPPADKPHDKSVASITGSYLREWVFKDSDASPNDRARSSTLR